MTTRQRYERLLARRAPIEDRQMLKFSEAYEDAGGESLQYLLGAMKPLDAKYTRRLAGEGDRVENQLKAKLDEDRPSVEFRRQGSVSNHTHIRFYSDVDVLVITRMFQTLERPQIPMHRYEGNPVDDLETLRENCAAILRKAFPAGKVDTSGSTAVALSGGSLACKVDVVPANWLNTNAFTRGAGEHTRGIQVLDVKQSTRITNFPLLFNFRINEKDSETRGIAKMCVRLLKTIKADHEEENVGKCLDISSFDLCSIVYRMPAAHFIARKDRPLVIVSNLISWLGKLIDNEEGRKRLSVVDDSRPIFQRPSQVQALTAIRNDLQSLYSDARSELGGVTFLAESHF